MLPRYMFVAVLLLDAVRSSCEDVETREHLSVVASATIYAFRDQQGDEDVCCCLPTR